MAHCRDLVRCEQIRKYIYDFCASGRIVGDWNVCGFPFGRGYGCSLPPCGHGACSFGIDRDPYGCVRQCVSDCLGRFCRGFCDGVFRSLLLARCVRLVNYVEQRRLLGHNSLVLRSGLAGVKPGYECLELEFLIYFCQPYCVGRFAYKAVDIYGEGNIGLDRGEHF